MEPWWCGGGGVAPPRPGLMDEGERWKASSDPSPESGWEGGSTGGHSLPTKNTIMDPPVVSHHAPKVLRSSRNGEKHDRSYDTDTQYEMKQVGQKRRRRKPRAQRSPKKTIPRRSHGRNFLKALKMAKNPDDGMSVRDAARKQKSQERGKKRMKSPKVLMLVLQEGDTTLGFDRLVVRRHTCLSFGLE